MHSGWDEDFNWKMLYEAEQYIRKFYRRIFKKEPITKEKYGYLRYEMTYYWVTSEEEAAYFFEIVKRACAKYKDVAVEICLDLKHLCGHPYYNGYFAGLLSQRDVKGFDVDKPWREHYQLKGVHRATIN